MVLVLPLVMAVLTVVAARLAIVEARPPRPQRPPGGRADPRRIGLSGPGQRFGRTSAHYRFRYQPAVSQKSVSQRAFSSVSLALALSPPVAALRHLNLDTSRHFSPSHGPAVS